MYPWDYDQADSDGNRWGQVIIYIYIFIYIWDIGGIMMMGFEGVPSGCTKDTVRYCQQGMQLGGKHKMNTL